ncbi:MAG: hypothetical protein AAFP20_00440 [Cyanobacteria bacterium J06614_10]
MTYLSNNINEDMTPIEQSPAETTTFEKLKMLLKESGMRSQRIGEILRKAFSETRTEFQAGRSVISPLAKEVTTETVSTVKEKGQQAASTVNKAWQDDAEELDLADRLVKFLQVMSQMGQETLLPALKKQVGRADNLLDGRYGDRYASIKARIQAIQTWLVDSADAEKTAPETADNSEPTVVIEVESETVK